MQQKNKKNFHFSMKYGPILHAKGWRTPGARDSALYAGKCAGQES